MEKRSAYPASQSRPALQVAECRALDSRRFLPERRQRVRAPATRQVGSSVEPAAIAIRSAHAQSGATRDDDLGIKLADVIDGESGAVGGGGAPIGQEHVRTGQQAAEQAPTRLGFDVNGDAGLAAVAQLEDEGGVGAGRRTE